MRCFCACWVSKTIKDTLNNLFDPLSLEVKKLSETFELIITVLRNSITDSNENKGNAGSTLECNEPIAGSRVSPNELSNAIMQAEATYQLNKNINLGRDTNNTKTPSNTNLNTYKKIIKGSNKNIAEIAAADVCKWIYIGNLNSR